MSRARPVSFMICDEIRTEASAKEILIGCYAGTINFLQPLPRAMRLGIRLDFDNVEFDDAPLSFMVRIQDPTGAVFAEFGGEVSVQDRSVRRGAVSANLGGVQFSAVGEYLVSARIGDPEFVSLGGFTVQHKLPATAVQPQVASETAAASITPPLPRDSAEPKPSRKRAPSRAPSMIQKPAKNAVLRPTGKARVVKK